MRQKNALYERRKHYISRHLDQIIYKVLIEEPTMKWELSEIQDKIEDEWGIRPYRSTLLRHAHNFYRKHGIPLFHKTSFDDTEDTYQLNTLIDYDGLKELFKPKPRGRPRKRPQDKQEPDAQS